MSAAVFDARMFDVLPPSLPEAARPKPADVPALGALLDEDLSTAETAARLERVKSAQNPLLEAAGPLLRMLAAMPEALPDETAVTALRELLVREVSLFQNLCDKADVAWKQVAVVRYCLCTALDEAANRSAWGASGAWATQGLLITFEGEVDGGEKFFLLIGRMASDPQAYADTLEVLYQILGLGFEGRYSVVADGHRHLEQIRQRLSTLVASVRDPASGELSVHWRGAGAIHASQRRVIPAWLSAALALLLVMASFGFLLDVVGARRDVVEARILAIGLGNGTPTPIVSAPEPKLRLQELLREEIAQGLVKLREEPKRTLVTFPGDTMFVSGRSEALAPMVAVLEKVADEVKRAQGRVEIVGYTDNVPIRTRQFPDNMALSRKRAEFVRDVFLRRGLSADEVSAEGRGELNPLGDNATPDGRAQNRRVELYVTL